MPKRAREAILHTRFWTQGRPENNDNNHPISTGGIVGVHNGGIHNDDDLFRQLGPELRIAEVDSEAAFALLGHGSITPETGHLTDLLEEVMGSAALAWFDRFEDAGTLHLARLATSPVHVAQTEAGSLIFASTKGAVDDACAYLDLTIVWEEDLKEGTYLRVTEGRITEERTFKVDPGYWVPRSWTSYRSAPRAWSWEDEVDSAGWTSATAPAHVYDLRQRYGKWEAWCDTCEEFEDHCYCGEPSSLQAEAQLSLVEEHPEVAQVPVAGDHANTVIYGRDLYAGNVQPVGSMEFARGYGRRIEQYTRWVDAMVEHGSDGWHIEQAGKRQHLWTRPGDWVMTDVLSRDGSKQCAQVVDVPDRFPDGDYLLKVHFHPAEPSFAPARFALVVAKAHEFTTSTRPPAWLSARIGQRKALAAKEKGQEYVAKGTELVAVGEGR